MSEATEALAQAIMAEAPVPTKQFPAVGDNVIDALDDFFGTRFGDETAAEAAIWLISNAAQVATRVAAGGDPRHLLIQTLIAVAATARASGVDLADAINLASEGMYGLRIAITFVE
jgi:hypothetical protein